MTFRTFSKTITAAAMTAVLGVIAMPAGAAIGQDSGKEIAGATSRASGFEVISVEVQRK